MSIVWNCVWVFTLNNGASSKWKLLTLFEMSGSQNWVRKNIGENNPFQDQHQKTRRFKLGKCMKSKWSEINFGKKNRPLKYGYYALVKTKNTKAYLYNS